MELANGQNLFTGSQHLASIEHRSIPADLSFLADDDFAYAEDDAVEVEETTGTEADVVAVIAVERRADEIAQADRPVKLSLDEARARGFTYLIRPSILRWEDHDSDWLGGGDRAKILLEAIDTASGNAADVTVIEGWGGADPALQAGAAATPAAVLETPLSAYAERLVPLQATARRR